MLYHSMSKIAGNLSQNFKRVERDYVLIHNDHKKNRMDIEWLGPYRIHQIKTPYYGILIDSVIKKIHGNRLKTYFSERDPP